MVIHDDPLVVFIDMNIRRGDMRIEIVTAKPRHPVGPGQRRVRHRVLRLEQTGGKRHDRARIDRPRPLHPVGIGKADALALVVREIHVQRCLFPRCPVRHPKHRWPVDIGKRRGLQPGGGGCRKHVCGDQRPVGQPGDRAGEGRDAPVWSL